MTVRQADLNGNPYVGVVCSASEDLVLAPFDTGEDQVGFLEKTLGARVVTLSLGGTSLVGTMVAINSRGAVVGDIATEEEMRVIEGSREVHVLEGRLNCAGNLILTNDARAWVHPRLSKDARRAIGDVLDVEVAEGDLAGMGVVGSVACATNKGVLVHPKARPEELEALKEFFGLPVAIGTLNYGSPMIGACTIANSRGAVTGTPSTGIELGRLEDALGLIE